MAGPQRPDKHLINVLHETINEFYYESLLLLPYPEICKVMQLFLSQKDAWWYKKMPV